MKSSTMPYILPLLEPFTRQLEEMYALIEDEVYALAGSRCFIHKGELFCSKKGKTDKVVILPESLRPALKDFLHYRTNLATRQSKLQGYLREAKTDKDKVGSFLAYLPKSCHFLYDATTTTHEIPAWVDELVAESLMLRTLYEMS